MKILDSIITKDTGTRKVMSSPIPTYLSKEVDTMDYADIGYVISHELRIGVRSLIPDLKGTCDSEHKARSFIADTIYGEVIEELRKIEFFIYEKHLCSELENMVSDLITKLR
jgi:hypothetical protein